MSGGLKGSGLMIDDSPNLVAVVQSNTTLISPPLIGLRCDAAGALKIRSGDTDHVLVVLAGETIKGSISMVFDTGTALTDPQLIGLKERN